MAEQKERATVAHIRATCLLPDLSIEKQAIQISALDGDSFQLNQQ
jgi:hypothetical protein